TDLDLNCEIWTAYGDNLLAVGGGKMGVELNFEEEVKLEKDQPITWRVFCDLRELGDEGVFQVNLKTNPAALVWESASRQLFNEVRLLTDNLAGVEIRK